MAAGGWKLPGPGIASPVLPLLWAAPGGGPAGKTLRVLWASPQGGNRGSLLCPPRAVCFSAPPCR